ncbi:MAG: hypothetical protein Q9223_007685 [Gallowayella weberi]
MPKGQKFVDWTNPGNDKKLLHAIITTNNIHINYEKVAKAFGDAVPASCISLRVNKIRKEVRDKGVTPTSTQSRPSKATWTAKVLDEASNATEEDDMNSNNDDGQPAGKNRNHSKTISGRITKPRKSPRKASLVRKDYGKLSDPYDFEDVIDEDGDAGFNPRGVSPGDPLDSDREYMEHDDTGEQVEI